MKFSDKLAKALFVLSLVVLIFLYGFWAGYKGLPPKGFLDQALSQARNSEIFRSLPRYLPFLSPQNTEPQVYERTGVHVEEPEKVQPGLTLITGFWDWDNSGALNVGAKLIDRNGNTLHRWQLDRSKLFSDEENFRRVGQAGAALHGTYMFSNGDLLLNLEYVGLVRVDACGEVLWELPEYTHHSIHRAEDGTFWIPAIHEEKRAGSDRYPNGFPGLDGRSVWVDRIIHVSEEGKILDDINVLDVLYMNDLERYIPKMAGGATDVTHINDVEPLSTSMAEEYPLFEAGDLVVSARHLDLVFVFDPETLNVKWHAIQPFMKQHDPDFIGNGWIGVFDNNVNYNRGKKELVGGSRIVALQPHTGKIEIRFPTHHSDPFYTNNRGKWQLLENGNMLLTEEDTGRIVEVSPDGRTVWEWIHKPFGDSRVPNVTKATRYDLTKEDIASWPCSSVNTSDNTKQEGG